MSAHDTSATVAGFLDAVAARQPTPGGGSVAALAGALAAAMGEMVLNYSVGRKGAEAQRDQLTAVLAELHNARHVMLQLMLEDQLAYQAFSQLKALPADASERRDKLPAAILACIRVPQAMAATAVAILELCQRVTPIANRYLLSDLSVCADLAMATVRCGLANVRINLPELTDPADRRAVQASIDQAMEHALRLIRQVGPAIWARIEQRS